MRCRLNSILSSRPTLGGKMLALRQFSNKNDINSSNIVMDKTILKAMKERKLSGSMN